MALIPQADGTYKDTNNQSDRADLVKQGFYIDNSGVYAPGAGQRVGDTFSGSMANQNEAPSPTRLPVINGTPVSPSNGTTGPQTGAIMYRSDPLYSQYFGPGTPGYSSTTAAGSRGDPTLGATGPVAGQQSLTDWLSARGTPVGASGAPVPAAGAQPTNTSTAPAPSNPAVASPAASSLAADTSNAWLAGVAGANPAGGFGPYATADAPALEDQGRYVENGNVIQKYVDQYGHPYYHTVGASGSPTPATPGGAATPTTTPATPATPATPTTPAAPTGTVPLALADGTVVQVPTQFYADYQADQKALANANAKAQQFGQGIQQGQLDVQRMVAVYTHAYQDALVAGNSATLAQNMAIEKMRDDLQQQTIDLNKVIQQQTAAYQNAQLENTRSGQAQTLSLEREKLALARQQTRGRRLPQVRYA